MGESAIANACSDVVLCYCDSDAPFCSAFSGALDALREERVISGWREQRVSPEDGELPVNDSSQVVLALLSPDFLATGFLQRDDIASRVQQSGQSSQSSLAVIPVLVHPVETIQGSLSESFRPPSGAPPLSEAGDVEAVVQQVMARIRGATARYAADSGPNTMDQTIARTIDHGQDSSKKSTWQQPPEASRGIPERIGRYRIINVLGQGAFGAVYLAQDEQLNRSVAIKTPHPRRNLRPGDVESYMREARMVAQLDHPGIVPVYDVGQSDEGQFFVVSKVIDGKDLSKRLREARPSFIDSARLVALAAEALHYAHQRDMVHRDVKPANILIGDSDGRPFIADFGLAIHESDLGQGPRRAGTPAYMSPEQARGESHRVDGRSDVFSLGVVLYELMTGRLPFRNDDIEELLKQIARSEARPPRQFEPAIPRELERICLKAMSNRIMDRYTTAQDFAVDLWYFLDEATGTQGAAEKSTLAAGEAGDSTASGRAPTPPSGWVSSGAAGKLRRGSTGSGQDALTSTRRGSGTAGHISTQQASHRSTRSGAGVDTVAESGGDDEFARAKVVAKGLRAFDGHDADFFLELVPGPRDRYGLPDCIRFWKTRLEETSGEQTFPVGVIYGPSGCGKSSLVRAGLVPQLGSNVHVVFLDAASRDTEERLTQRLRRLCPDASPDANLPALMAWIRRGRGIASETKLVLVIDQFEQWLQTHENDRNGDLLDALRQCDGVRVQCVLMIRVDFMMSIHRFMNDLESPIREGFNSAAVDLFDPMHARKVLRLFGESYGQLPAEPAELDAASQAFIEKVANDLGPDGKIVPVQLALFADMCKGRPWRPETLKQFGGVRGIGAKFLEETFDSTTAPLEHRVHQKACRAVLKSLLPEVGSNIRGQACSREQLAKTAGYDPQSRDFEGMLTVLDCDTRLITPIEAEGDQSTEAEGEQCIEGESGQATKGAEKGKTPPPAGRYQLTHDYLVPSLREWLTKKQRETARGRAELKLEEFSRLWNERPTSKLLPGPIDWLNLRMLTRAGSWTAPQRKMMRAGGRRLGVMSAAAAAVVLAISLGAMQVKRQFAAQRLAGTIKTLAAASLSQAPDIITLLKPERAAAAPLLLAGTNDKKASDASRLNASLAALALGVGGADDKRLLDDVYEKLASAAPDDQAVMVEVVADHAKPLGQRASREFAAANGQTLNLLPLASLMAAYQPDNAWSAAARDAVANELASAPADAIGGWTRQLAPARQQVAPSLAGIFADLERPIQQRGVAGDLLVAFTQEGDANRVEKLVDVLVDATSPEQFRRTAKQLESTAREASLVMTGRLAELDKQAVGQVGPAREATGLRQMHLAAGILQMNVSADRWKAFAYSADPTVRSLLIEHAHALGLDPAQIIERLAAETDVGIRRALLLTLGGYDKGQLEPVKPAEFAKTLDQLRQDPDAGLHSAAAWLRERWEENKIVDPPQVAAAKPRDEQAALAEKGKTPTWYATGAGHELVVMRGPVEFGMGSTADDPDREGGALDPLELRHPASVPRSFAIATKEVTVAQFQEAWKELQELKEFQGEEGKPVAAFDYPAEKAPEPNCPAINVDWFKAAAYCNWLSKREGIPPNQWCYSPGEQFAHQMVLPKDYLDRTGYRLPTEAEWEFACRAGAGTGRFYGESRALLSSYGWYAAKGGVRTWPVGRLKPNDYGLFDVYGNVSEWCMDEPRVYSEAAYDDAPATDMQLLIDVEKLRVHRGGGFQYVPEMVTSAARDRSDPDYAYWSLGFRVARTWPE